MMKVLKKEAKYQKQNIRYGKRNSKMLCSRGSKVITKERAEGVFG